MLVTTKIAAEKVGLSEYELRMGFKQGRYPAIEIGQGERARRLRWNLDLLRAAITENMAEKARENKGKGGTDK